MNKVNVLIVSKLDLYHGFNSDISALDSSILVKDGVNQLVTELRKNGVKGATIDRMAKQANMVKGNEENLDSLLAEAEVIFGSVLFPENMAARAPRLKWVHINNVGIDRYLAMDFFTNPNITVTNSRGGVAIPIAEHVLTFMLMLAKNAPRMLDNKREKVWERFVTLELRDRVIGIIGLGAIGSEIARLAKGVGMRVIATRRSATRREQGIDPHFPYQTEI